MDGLTFLIIILLIVAVLGFGYMSIYNNFQHYLLKINESESKIDSVLRERFDLLCKAADFIKENTKEEIMKELESLDKENLSSFDFGRKLSSLTREYDEIKFTNRNLIKIDQFVDIDFSLKENDAKLDGYISYYNDSVSKFNRLVRMFPSNITAILCRYKEKTFYDGKNMSDKNDKDFKL
jgi:LemA protein